MICSCKLLSFLYQFSTWTDQHRYKIQEMRKDAWKRIKKHEEIDCHHVCHQYSIEERKLSGRPLRHKITNPSIPRQSFRIQPPMQGWFKTCTKEEDEQNLTKLERLSETDDSNNRIHQLVVDVGNSNTSIISGVSSTVAVLSIVAFSVHCFLKRRRRNQKYMQKQSTVVQDQDNDFIHRCILPNDDVFKEKTRISCQTLLTDGADNIQDGYRKCVKNKSIKFEYENDKKKDECCPREKAFIEEKFCKREPPLTVIPAWPENSPHTKDMTKHSASMEEIDETKQIKELTVSNTENKQVSIVKPLMSPDPEKSYGNTPPHLNWDEVFRYLAKNLPTADYRLFFNILYGNCHHLQSEGRDMGTYISHVENNTRGGIETRIFELFKNWKQLMGSGVNIACIEQALEERLHNLTLEEFKKFMREPPLLPKRINKTGSRLSLSWRQDNNMLPVFPDMQQNYTNYMLPDIGQCRLPPTENSTMGLMTNGPIIQEIEDQHNELSSLNSSSSSSTLTSNNESAPIFCNGTRFFEKKRSMFSRKKKQIRGTATKEKRMGIVRTPLKIKTRSRSRKKEYKELQFQQMKQCAIDTTKQLLPLLEKPLSTTQYNLLLRHTVDDIIQQTGESRSVVLSLLYKDFCEREKFETKRNEKFHFLYSANRCLVLRNPQYETLELYAEHARKNIVRYISRKSGNKYNEPEALFLSYDGQPYLSKEKVTTGKCVDGAATASYATCHEEENSISSSVECVASQENAFRENTNEYGHVYASIDEMETGDQDIELISRSKNSKGDTDIKVFPSANQHELGTCNRKELHQEDNSQEATETSSTMTQTIMDGNKRCHFDVNESFKEERESTKAGTKRFKELPAMKWDDIGTNEQSKRKGNRSHNDWKSSSNTTDSVFYATTKEDLSKTRISSAAKEDIPKATFSVCSGMVKENGTKTIVCYPSRKNKDDISKSADITPFEGIKNLSDSSPMPSTSSSFATTMLSSDTLSNKVDDVLVYVCISSIVNDHLKQTRGNKENYMNIELD